MKCLGVLDAEVIGVVYGGTGDRGGVQFGVHIVLGNVGRKMAKWGSGSWMIWMTRR